MHRDEETPVAEPTDEPVQDASRPRRLILPRRLPFSINWPVLLLVVGLVLLAVGLVLLNLELLPPAVLGWWPVVLLVPAALWFLAALFQRRPVGLVRSSALLGLAISLLLSAQNIAPPGVTLVGVTLIATGTGLLLRGLLLRQQPIG